MVSYANNSITRNHDSSVPSGQNTGQFGAGSAVMSQGRGSISNSASVGAGTYQNPNHKAKTSNYGGQIQNVHQQNQLHWQQQKPLRQTVQSNSLGPHRMSQPATQSNSQTVKPIPNYMNKIGNAKTNRTMPKNLPKQQPQKQQSRTLRAKNTKASSILQNNSQEIRPQQLQNFYPQQYNTIEQAANTNEQMISQYATGPNQMHLRNETNFDALQEASNNVQNIPITGINSNLMNRSSSLSRMQELNPDLPTSSPGDYNTEALKYPPHQSKILMGETLNSNSSNPRFDLPRQIQTQNFVGQQQNSDQRSPHHTPTGNQSLELQKQLLDQYYEQKFKKEQEIAVQKQRSNESSELQKFMEYAQNFMGHQKQIIQQTPIDKQKNYNQISMQQQQSPQQQPVFLQQPMPKQQQIQTFLLQPKKVINEKQISPQINSPGGSSGGSDQDLEAMIYAMKHDVQEIKQGLFKDKNLSDRGSSGKKPILPISVNRGKSVESKASEKIPTENSYKRPKKDMPQNSVGRPANMKERSKSSKNSKGLTSGSGSKHNRQSQKQILPDNIFGQKPQQEENQYIDLRNRNKVRKDQPEQINSLTQFSEQTFNAQVPDEEEKQQVPVQSKKPEEQIKPKKKQKDKASQDLKVNTEEPLIRNTHHLQNENEFKNLNIAGSVSESDDENQQRIFQFSPLSSKKQEGQESSENESSSEGPQNYNNDNQINEEIKSEQLLQQNPPYSRLNFQQQSQSLNQENSQGEQRIPRHIQSQAESTGRFIDHIKRNKSGVLNNQAPSSGDDTFNSQRHIQEQISQIQQHNELIENKLLQAQSYRNSIQEQFVSNHRVSETNLLHQSDSQRVQEQITQRLLDNNMMTTERIIAMNNTTLDQRDQTIIAQPIMKTQECQTNSRPLLKSVEIQTEKEVQPVRNLSPFETYDLLFIRDLVNNLNYDNEVLHDNANDLKAAFMFLYNEHKQLQFQYQKEKRNETLIKGYRERVEILMDERDQAIDSGMKMKAKVEVINDVMQLAVQESQLQQKEDEELIEQLSQENQELKKVLGIHRKMQNLDKKKKSTDKKDKTSNDGSSSEDDDIDKQIEENLMTAEQEVQRTQDDYLLMLREEQDLQFSREIDEHKEIIQKIYDDKLVEKTNEIGEELQESLTKQIQEQLKEEITKEIETKVAEDIREDVKQEVREEIQREVTLEVTEGLTRAISQQVTESLTEKITARLNVKIEQELREKYEKMYKDKYGSFEELPTQQQDQDNRKIMESLKLQHQRSDNSNEQTTQDLEALMQGQNRQSIPSQSSAQDETEEAKFEDTEKFTQQQTQLDENEQTAKLFANEKAKFKADLMKSYGGSLSNTMPAQKKVEELRRSKDQSSKSGSGTSGQSDDWNGNEDQNYDFEQIFEDQALSKEEEELFNQLKARDEGQTFDLTKERSDREEEKREIEDDGDLDETLKYNHHLNQDQNIEDGAFRLRGSERNPNLNINPNQNKNERYYQNMNQGDDFDDEEIKAESPNQINNQDEDFQRDPNDDQDEIQEQQNHGYSSAERIVESDTQDEDQQIRSRPSRNQFQGFQGQANLGYQGQTMDQLGIEDGPQGQSRGGQRQNISVTIPGQDIAGDDQAIVEHNQDTQHVRGQGFQGQVQGQGLYDFSLARPNQIQNHEELKTDHNDSEQPNNGENRNSAGSFNNDEIGGGQSTQNLIDDAYEYDDFFSGLQNEMMQQSSGSGVQKEGSSQIASQDLFNQNNGENVMDSTKGLGQMISKQSPSKTEEQAQQIQDLLENDTGGSNHDDDDFIDNFEELVDEENRNPENEEVYDYFLDANKDENHNDNAGYHIIDQEDLESSKKQDSEQIDEDDLDQIQDEELKQYRYNNMLEDLKDKIAEEESEDKQ